jgi:hypothetical protein
MVLIPKANSQRKSRDPILYYCTDDLQSGVNDETARASSMIVIANSDRRILAFASSRIITTLRHCPHSPFRFRTVLLEFQVQLPVQITSVICLPYYSYSCGTGIVITTTCLRFVAVRSCFICAVCILIALCVTATQTQPSLSSLLLSTVLRILVSVPLTMFSSHDLLLAAAKAPELRFRKRAYVGLLALLLIVFGVIAITNTPSRRKGSEDFLFKRNLTFFHKGSGDPSPTVMPTMIPTASPTMTPTVIPTMMPTKMPSKTPTMTPTVMPNTMMPTKIPTMMPTTSPTTSPTMMPVTPWVCPNSCQSECQTSAACSTETCKRECSSAEDQPDRCAAFVECSCIIVSGC